MPNMAAFFTAIIRLHGIVLFIVHLIHNTEHILSQGLTTLLADTQY